jgi:O-antigen/teichoic acid export membrane protein
MEHHKHALRGSAALAGVSAALVALPVAIGAPWLLGLFGRSFRGSGAVLIVMVGAGVFEAVSQALNQQFLSQAKMWWNLVMATIRGLVLVTVTFLLVPVSGAVGAAMAILLSQGAAVAFVLVLMARGEAALVEE